MDTSTFKLAPFERKVADLMMDGHSRPYIGEHLGIDPETLDSLILEIDKYFSQRCKPELPDVVDLQKLADAEHANHHGYLDKWSKLDPPEFARDIISQAVAYICTSSRINY